MKLIAPIVSLLFLLNACGENQEDNKSENASENVTVAEGSESQPAVVVNYDGFQLMQSACFSCHSPNPSVENPVAPTLAEVKLAYLDQYPEKKAFQDAFLAFLENPTKERAIMDDAIDQFGLMPQMSLGKDKSQAIASYIYENQVQNSDWFNNDFKSEQRRVKLLSDNLSDLDRGFEYAMGTKSLLGKNLKGQLKSEGTIGALNFCNLKAYHFTDSMSQVFDATIKRVSDKPRNPVNEANELELEIMEQFKEKLAKGEEINGTTREVLKGYVNGYYPIVTNDMCMKCHGSVDKMEEGVHEKITTLYPTDQATGYLPNQLRGIWVVKMKKRAQ